MNERSTQKPSEKEVSGTITAPVKKTRFGRAMEDKIWLQDIEGLAGGHTSYSISTSGGGTTIKFGG